MSRLAAPGLGDLIDRISILKLKIEHYANEEVDHLELEERMLKVRVLRSPMTADARVQTMGSALLRLNRKLWEIEDAMRAWRKRRSVLSIEWPKIAYCGMQMQELNDTRAALVHDLNVLAGDAAPHEREKADGTR